MLNKKSSAVVSVSILIAALLAGCGGGSGSGDVVVPVKNIPLAVAASTSISLQSGTSANFKITGGGSGATFVHYSASSSNNAAATASISGDVLTVTGKGGGFGKITVLDSASNSVSFDFIVSAASSPLPFKVNAPSQVALGLNKPSTFEIIGGVLPYSVASSKAQVLSASVTGSQLTMTGLSNGTANVVVFDGVGTSFTIGTLVGDGDVTPVPIYSTAPATLNLKPGISSSYLIGGGTPPYFVGTSNPSIIKTSLAGNTVEITSLAAGLSDVVVTDAKGGSFKIGVNVASTTKPFFTTSPATINLSPNATTSYVVSGGTPPYFASSSNANVASVSISDETLRVTALTSGSSNVVVFDSDGKSFQSVVVSSSGITPFFATAPSSVTLKSPEVGTYQVNGGKAPYVAVSSNTSVATASMNGSELQIASKAPGSATVVVRDAIGSAITVSVITN